MVHGAAAGLPGQGRGVISLGPPTIRVVGSKVHILSGNMAVFTWTFVVAFLLLAIFWWGLPGQLRSFYRKCKAFRGLPGWPRQWLWGNLLQMKDQDEKSFLRWISFVSENRCKISCTWIGPFHPYISIHHCDAVRTVLKEPKDRKIYRLLMPWLGEGLLIAEGSKWYRNRHLLTPAFHFSILKPYMAVYKSSVEVLIGKWSAAARKNEPVLLFDSLSLMSLDIILQCAFSYKSDCQNVKTRHPYVKSVYELIELTTDRFFVPFYAIDWIYYLSPSGRREKEACRIVHEHSEKVIRERKKALNLKGSRSEPTPELTTTKRTYLDFLDVLLSAVDDDGKGLTDLEIRDEVDTFMFEGHDTTTSAMSWTLYLLAKHPEHQEKVREEVRAVLDGRDWLEYDDLNELKYTQWCIKEAMRLYPPVFNVYRMASKDIELDGHVIPEGTELGIFIFSIHRHPDLWENPNEFDPLRFHPDNAKDRDPYAYIPFSAGARNCIGQNFAMNEMRTVISSIVTRFSLSLVEDHKVEIIPRIILRTRNDIKIKLEPLV